jgi:SAM-dependent methyltransferase
MRITALVPTHHLLAESMAWIIEARNIFDEVIVLIDQKRATPGTIARAEEVASHVVWNNRDTWYDPNRFSLLGECNSDWVFLLEYDEQLSLEWQQQDRWRQILETTQFTNFWVPRRWNISPTRYINSNPWWPDFQLRLFRNNLKGTMFPAKLHEDIRVPGPTACFHNLAIHHHVLWLLSREEREAKAAYYEQLNPGFGSGYYYLYEDYRPSLAPVPEPAKLDLNREIIRMDKLSSERISKISLEVSVVPRKVRISTIFWLDARVTNEANEPVYSVPPHPVRLAYHWIERATRQIIVFEGNRSGLFPGVDPGEVARCRMMVTAPDQPGEYILQTTMLQEGACWFENIRPEILREFVISVTKEGQDEDCNQAARERPGDTRVGNVKEFCRNFPYGGGHTERVIEIPWALSKYNGGPRVLEVGCSFASENPEYIQGLLDLNIPELHGIDVSSVDAPHFIKKTADVRESGYETGFFDFILCISTLEHVGKDNTKHYKPVAELPPARQNSLQPDVEAMREMVRILKPGGKLIVTVPFGKFVDYGWFTHYDSRAISILFQSVPSPTINAEYFKYMMDGWMPCAPSELAETSYGDNGAPAAAGLACFEITKPF